jgi:acyl-ACP thioesterase
VSLARPRDRDSREFLSLKEELLAEFHLDEEEKLERAL